MTREDRRDFLKGGAVLAGVAAASTVAAPAEAQNVKLNPAAKAVLPDGKELSRQQVLTQLGLDPNTSPDAWLAIVACGSNASALSPEALKGLVSKGVLNAKSLDKATQMKLK